MTFLGRNIACLLTELQNYTRPSLLEASTMPASRVFSILLANCVGSSVKRVI